MNSLKYLRKTEFGRIILTTFYRLSIVLFVRLAQNLEIRKSATMEEKNKSSQPDIFYKVDVVVIGAGQAGLSAAYYLKKAGLEPGRGFVVLDDEFGPGGAWQHRWNSLTLSTVNGINDLPGMSFSEAVDTNDADLQANVAIPQYYEKYEKTFQLPVIRPVRVHEVSERNGRFFIRTNGVQFSARGLVNATGTWKTPRCPHYPGWEKFRGRQLHTAEYKNASEFRGMHVLIVGGGISAIQLLGEISELTR